MNNEPGSKPEEAAQKSAQFKKEMDEVRDSMAFLKDEPSGDVGLPRTIWPRRRSAKPTPDAPRRRPRLPPPCPPRATRCRQPRDSGRRPGASDDPFMQSVFDAGVWIDGTDPDLTTGRYEARRGARHEYPAACQCGRAGRDRAAPVPDRAFERRYDLSSRVPAGSNWPNDIFTDAAPLAARVIVNRVWAWHFGKPLVATQSDFGTQGEKPTHPELLDDLAARFIANGWSLKWLHREIMLSATYRQASHPRADGDSGRSHQQAAVAHESAPPGCRGLSRHPARSHRTLDDKPFGLSVDLDAAGESPPHRLRARQPRASEYRPALYDFPDPTMSAPQRDLTTSPLQQLFVMNSAFMKERAAIW